MKDKESVPPPTTVTVIYSDELRNVVKEMREMLAEGRIRYDDAIRVIKSAIKESIKTAHVSKSSGDN